MANLVDYIESFGETEITINHPLNEVDSAVFARFAYLPFHHTELDLEKEEHSVYQLPEAFSKLQEEVYHLPEDRELLWAMAKSRRYQNLQICGYRRSLDEDIQRQFTAVTVLLPMNEMYLAFMGTDSSLLGWKEDFNMSFQQNVPAQRSSVLYTALLAEKYPYKRLRLGGHSKGGNLAIYAALLSQEEVQKRIISVDNFDGPGFFSDFIEENLKDIVLPYTHIYVPQSSVIGRMLEQIVEPTVVFSSRRSLGQHDLYSWEIEGEAFARAVVSSENQAVNQTLKKWLEGSTMEQRSAFVDAVYQMAASEGVETFEELRKKMMSLPSALKAYRNMSPSQQKNVLEMSWLFLKSYAGSLYEKYNPVSDEE